MRALKNLSAKYPVRCAGAGVALFAALAALYATLTTNAPSFDPKYAIYTDVSNFYWIQTMLDHSLFPRDPLGIYASFRTATLGYFYTEAPWVWFTALFMRVTPYSHGLRVLTVMGCAAGALMVFRMALKSCARPAAALAAVIFPLYFLSMDTFFGVPRIYGLLVFIAFLLAAEEKRFLFIPFFIFAAFVVYPAISVGMAFSALLMPFAFREHFSGQKLLPRYALAMALSALACLAALWHSLALSGLVRAFGGGSGFEIYKLYQFVRKPVNPGNPADMVAYFMLNINEHGYFYPVTSALLGLVFLAGLRVRSGLRTMIPTSVRATLAGSLAAFAVLYALHPVSASRQMVFIIPMTMVFLAADGLYRIGGGKSRTTLVAAVAGSIFAVLHLGIGLTTSCRTFGPVYDYLSALPKDTIVAGHPASVLLYTAPVFSRKQVFVSDEHRDQYILSLNRGSDFDAMRSSLLAALYSGSPDKACALRPAYGVNYIVLEDDFYTPEYLAQKAASASPRDVDIARVAAGSPDPRGFYHYARGHAAFSWKNARSGGVVFDLAGCGEKGARL